MALFTQAGFDTGEWAGSLATRLRSKQIIPGRQPKARLYRHTWTHWIQVEPSGFKGPAHWLGKPAVVAHDGSLYVGYYIERGLDQHERPEYVVTPEWHWHALRACLGESPRRREIDSVMQQLPSQLRQVSALCGSRQFAPPYEGETTLLGFDRFVEACPPDEWINAYLGARFGLDECLTLQERLVDKLISPLLRGVQLEAIVLEKREELLAP